MALTMEWKKRIDGWRKELPRHFYRKLAAVDLAGFTTRDRLTPGEARRGAFQPMPAGTPWGAKWEYAWFQTEVVVPKGAAGCRVVFTADLGGESLVFLNGDVAGALDWGHPHLTLSADAKAGDRFRLLLETYAGHGAMVGDAGPTPPERDSVPECPPTQRTIGEASFGVWEEDAYQLWIDVEVLWHLREALDPDSLRLAEIDQALRDFSTIADFEVPHEERLKSFRAARKRLAPLLKCTNGSTAPRMFAFGHAHLDVAWLWPLAETERKAARTFANQLSLIAEFPAYKYLQPQPHLFRFVKTLYPDLYAEVKEAVKAGRFIPEGATWIEPDTNVTGGESLIRQFLHGMRFYRQEFGVTCEMLWLPDVFGYSAALPQILRGCGIKYFATAKIFWNYNGGDPFPYQTFLWEGIDGSEVLTHLMRGYGGETHAGDLVSRWNQRPQKDGLWSLMFAFGHGDGGGGPTRDHLEMLRREADLEGAPRVRMAGPVEFFKDIEKRGVPPARYVGELYYQVHRGTYTSQARTKRGNRRAEIALREAEFWGAAAQALKRYAFPAAEMDETWKQTLLCQFHDILPGSSIRRVYEEAEATLAQVIATAEKVAAQATAALVKPGDGLTVFNSLPWPRAAHVPMPEGWTIASDAAGEALASQEVGGRALVEVAVPPCGWTTIRPGGVKKAGSAKGRGPTATKRSLENECLRVEFDAYGQVTSIVDKEAGRELAADACNAFRMYRDVPSACDAWDIDSTYAATPVDLPGKAKIEVLASGPLVARLAITRRLHDSSMRQEVTVRRGSRRVDFATVIDWQERHKLLKVAFPVNVFASEAVHEIQFGHLRRPTHLSRQYDADRFEVAQHKWTALAEEGRGFAVLNDSKYGVNVLGNTIALTLLKSALAPDMLADRGRQEFTYAFYAWSGGLADSGVVREGYDLNVPVVAAAGNAAEGWLFALDAPNIVVEAVKPAEDGSGDVIVRLYECMRTATRCILRTSLAVRGVTETDLLENERGGLRCEDGAVRLDFRPFEIKTLRFA